MSSKRKRKLQAKNPNPTVHNLVQKDFAYVSDPAAGRLFGQTYSNSGVPVTHTTALTVPAIYCAVRCISEDIAKMVWGVYKPTKGRFGYLPYYEHPLNDIFDQPNEWMSKYDLINFIAASYALTW